MGTKNALPGRVGIDKVKLKIKVLKFAQDGLGVVVDGLYVL